jgi:hypothetical protein
MMVDLKAEDIKETYETKSNDEADKYQKLGWLLIDTYAMGADKFFVLAWVKDGAGPRP